MSESEPATTKLIRYYYDPEETILFEEYFEVDGKKEGLSKSYYKNGNPMITANFINDKLDNEYRAYYMNGKIKEITCFNSGKKEGESREYYNNGQLMRIINYKNNKRDGSYKTYYENGELKSIIIYNDDMPIGGTYT